MTTTGSAPPRIVDLMHAVTDGDAGARVELSALLYDELRALADSHLRREAAEVTAPTSLVHDVVLRLSAAGMVPAERREFLALAAMSMRRLLIDRARRRAVHARAVESLAEVHDDPPGDPRVLALEEALGRLQTHDPELARVVDLRFLLELEVPAVAETLQLSTATVKRRWRAARAWLAREIRRILEE